MLRKMLRSLDKIPQTQGARISPIGYTFAAMQLITSHICMVKDIGVHGNLFGGIMMAWIDEAASAMAVSTCHTPNMVTVKVDELVFKKKVKEGYVIRIYGEVAQMGNTSVTFKIEARKVSVYTGEEDVVVTTNTTFVRIDEEGKPTPIPTIVKERHKDKA